MLGNDIPIVIAGNKADMEKNRHVKEDEAEAYVSLHVFNFIYLTVYADTHKPSEQCT